MKTEIFFTEMFDCIWKGEDLSRFDEFYAKDFFEEVRVSDDDKEPITLQMNYDELLKQAKIQKEQFRDTTFEMKKIVAGDDKHISVHFYSSSIKKESGQKQHRWVCGIWHLNDENKIDRVWAVVTPYYS
ncbi:MAG: hypothetical protein S4CHLAM20_10950 [Chlamydiia bacterium]|nr:hypothetical protein [Chlamydiia bacterium]